jgi:dTDP-4-dehydrorhamnose 3,5-epimerase
LRIERAAPDGLAILHWDVAADERGSFDRIFCRDDLQTAGIDFQPVQANLSRNPARHTLRGLHFQTAPHGEPKVVACLRGAIWDVAVDLRPRSSTFGVWRGFELGGATAAALHIPAGFAQGFITLEPDSEILYLMGAPYRPAAAAGIRWNDPQLAIAWPAAPALMSDRDAALPTFADVRAQLA